MKDIAILTFHTAYNYGAFLQAYALLEVLNSTNKVNAYLLDYQSESIKNRYRILNKNVNLKKILQTIICLPSTLKRNKVFRIAREEMYIYKKPKIQKKDLEIAANLYDAVIVGSDQVWNREIIKSDNSYFLDFVKPPIKKYSYAASFGKSKLSEDELKDVLSHIQDYAGIAIREKSVVAQIKCSIIMKQIISTVDPVFLLEAGKWRKQAIYRQRGKYILFFMVGASQSAIPAIEFAEKLAKEKNCKLIFLSDQERWYKYRNMIHVGVVSPKEFIGLIDQAECVVTNSFHATAFSIIFQRPFFVETEILRKDRIIELLDTCDLLNRGLKKGKAYSDELEINWEEVNFRLLQHVASSKKYINSIIVDLYKEDK